MNKQQQNAIQEMSKKRLLNGEQKRVLFKLFEQKIVKLEAKKRDEFNQRDEQAEKEARKLPEAQKVLELVKEYDALEIKRDKIKDQLYKNEFYGMSTSYSDNPSKLTIERAHPLLVAEQKKREKAVEQMSELRMKLQADIYGLPLEYAEMVEHLEQELNKI